ncbi:MAG: hypothetical protein FWG44_01860, partial [Oscillospiraceae bacterium]|nr:hypothetical protein [Oscillospiraceae bacterium]
IGIIGLLGLSGCADTRFVMNIAGIEVRAGEYINAQVSATQSAAAKFREENPDTDVNADGFDYFKQEVEGKSFSDWVYDKTLEMLKERAANSLLFDELGLSFTELEIQEIREYVESLWQSSENLAEAGLKEKTWGELYESIGIGKTSIEEVLLYGRKAEKVFHAYYDPDGIQGVPEDVLMQMFTDDYVRFHLIEVYLTDDDNNPITDEDILKDFENKANELADRLNAGDSFTVVNRDFWDFRYAYFEEEAEETEESEEEAEPEEANNDSEEPEQDVTEDENEESGETDETDGEAEDDIDYEALYDEYDNMYSELIARTDQPYFYTQMNDETYALPEEAHDFLIHMDLNTAAVFKTDECYFVFQKLDIYERDDWFETFRETLLHDLKGDEMNELVKEKAVTLDVSLNQAAIKRYKPEKSAKKGLI